MVKISRRTFLQQGAAAAALCATGTRLLADPLGLPVGLQLYSVRTLLPRDYAGTLKQVAAIGYREVEAAGFFGHSPAEVTQAMNAAGLHCVSAHYSLNDLLKDETGTLQFAKALGLQYVICASPTVADREKLKSAPNYFETAATADDWRWNAEQFNRLGKLFKAEGIQFGYHNHTAEFRDLGDGQEGYDVLLKDTDPALVTLELDCGWASAAGKNPVEYLTKYADRYSMLHVKDLKPTADGSAAGHRISTMLGKGTVDYRPIFAAAKLAGIKHYFVEQEVFDGDPLQELTVDYKYLHAM